MFSGYGGTLYLRILSVATCFQESADKKDKNKNKKQSVSVELSIKAHTCGYSTHELNDLLEREVI